MQTSRREAFRFWLKLGVISFGGPAGQIAIMHREVVESRCWVDERSFLQALDFCMLLPGPEALQLVIWLGRRLHGVPGALMAGLCFIGPRLRCFSRCLSCMRCTATFRPSPRRSAGTRRP